MSNPFLGVNGGGKGNRKVERKAYRGHCTLATANQVCSAHLVNLSENGALIAVLEPHTLSVGERIRLNVVQPGVANISIRGRIAHLKEHYSGVEFSPETQEDQNLLRSFLIKTGLVPENPANDDGPPSEGLGKQ